MLVVFLEDADAVDPAEGDEEAAPTAEDDEPGLKTAIRKVCGIKATDDGRRWLLSSLDVGSGLNLRLGVDVGLGGLVLLRDEALIAVGAERLLVGRRGFRRMSHIGCIFGIFDLANKTSGNRLLLALNLLLLWETVATRVPFVCPSTSYILDLLIKTTKSEGPKWAKEET